MGALLVVLALVLASAFFVAAEFALIAARRSAIEPLATSSPRARSTLAAMEDVSVMLACAQLGITVCGLVLGAVGEPAVAHLLEPLFASLGVPEAWVGSISFVLALALIVVIHVAFGEMVPKNIALTAPDRTAVLLAPVLRALATALGPLVRGMDHLANLSVRALGVTPSSEVASTVTRGELAAMVAASADEGLLDAADRELIDAALRFETARAIDHALAPAAIVTVGSTASVAEVERACSDSGFSRFPVAGVSLPRRYDGYIHVRDVLSVPADLRAAPMPASLIRTLPVLPSGSTLRQAVEIMQAERAHLCQIESDKGESRILMLEDAVEVLVGEIVDATRMRGDH